MSKASYSAHYPGTGSHLSAGDPAACQGPPVTLGLELNINLLSWSPPIALSSATTPIKRGGANSTVADAEAVAAGVRLLNIGAALKSGPEN